MSLLKCVESNPIGPHKGLKTVSTPIVPFKALLLVGSGILIEKIWIFQILHVPKLCSFAHSFQNYFCFRSRTFPSHVGIFAKSARFNAQ